MKMKEGATDLANQKLNTTSKSKIWVKLFELNGKKYCYDVGTNHIMQINDVLHDMLLIYDYANKKEVLKYLSVKYPEVDIQASFKTIEEFSKNKGGFILEKKIRLEFPFSENQCQFLLDNYLSHLVLNITDACNMVCKYCVYTGSYKYSRTHRNVSMPWQIIQKTIDFFIPRCKGTLTGIRDRICVGFYGGEPLLEHNKIFKTVEYVKEQYPDIFPFVDFRLTTNGTLLTPKIVNQLIKYNSRITISLDGPGKIHNKNRTFKNGAGTYNVITKNIDYIKNIALDYFKNYVSFSVIMAPEFEMPEVVKYFRDNYPFDIKVIFGTPEKYDTTYFDDFNMIEEEKRYSKQYNDLLIEYLKKRIQDEEDPLLFQLLKDNSADIHNRKIFKLPDETYPNGCCIPGLKRLFVDTAGRFHMCEKINQNFSIGDVESGFDVKKMLDLLEQYEESSNHCENCWAIRFCNSCILSAIENDHFSKERKKLKCEDYKEFLLTHIQFYIYLMEINSTIFDHPYTRNKDEVVEFLNYLEKHQIN